MLGPTRQPYLEKARATLAAREAWHSVFSPDVSPLRPATDPSSIPASPDGSIIDAADWTCDQSDKSDQSPGPEGRADHEVTWRVDAMRGQVPATGPVPILLARPEARTAPAGTCISCGDLLEVGRRFRCAPCVHAVERVLNEVREGATARPAEGAEP